MSPFKTGAISISTGIGVAASVFFLIAANPKVTDITPSPLVITTAQICTCVLGLTSLGFGVATAYKML